MRDQLIGFVKAFQARVLGYELRRAIEIGDRHGITLTIGYGYFDPDKVMVHGPADTNGGRELRAHNATVEEAVDLLLKSFEPE